MPHDEHFLSRLDRVSLPLVELALTLYNDAPLVKVILQGARAPEGATRIALSLEHPVDGPFVVVARDGGFVTCLGKGMSPAPHPVITRAQIDAELRRRDVARDRAETAMRLIGRRSGVGVLLERIYTAGEFMGREEIYALALWQPLMRPLLVALYTSAVNSVDVLRARLLLSDRLRAADRKTWSAYWLGAWASAHLLVLAAMDGREDFSAFANADDLKEHLTWGVAGHGIQAFALRAAWAAGRLSKTLLPVHKRRFSESDTTWSIGESALSLVTIAGGHNRVRAEVLKKLDLAAPAEGAPAADHIRHIVGGLAIKALNDPEGDVRAEALACGRHHHQWVNRGDALDGVYRFAKPDEIPEALVVAALFDARWDVHGAFNDVRRTMRMGPAISRLAAEDLYYPKKYHALFERDLCAETVESLLRARRGAIRQPKPARAAEQPGRNEVCACGSGKKYKKCCGR